MPLQVINPYDRELLCELPYDTGDALRDKVDAARRAQEPWRQLSVEQRIEVVEAGLGRYREAAEEIARDVTLQMGKPLRQARQELATVFERAEHMISIAGASLAPEVLPAKEGFHRRIEHAPLGVVFNIAAWNYPLIIPVNVIVPALLAGNTVILKHSAKTPLCGRHFERAFADSELPDLVTSLVLDHQETASLITSGKVSHVSFTGSVQGGREIYRAACSGLLDAGLELGGKDPAYVAADADLEFAVENIVDGACYNAGQSCCAVERVYVHHEHHDEFLERAKVILEGYTLGDPLDERTTMGPLASASADDALAGQVRDAVERGARLLHGGRGRDDSRGNFFEPTLLTDVPNDALVMQEESFGPIVPVLSVKDDEEASRLMADSRFGLTASVWTRERRRAERFARDLDVGTVFQNRCDYLDPALPWTGARDSGIGSTLSHHGFLHLTRRKSIHFRTAT